MITPLGSPLEEQERLTEALGWYNEYSENTVEYPGTNGTKRGCSGDTMADVW